MTTFQQRSRSNSYHSFEVYSYTDDSDGSYTIEDISGVLDAHSTTSTSWRAVPPTPLSSRSRIQYGGTCRLNRPHNTAAAMSMFRDVHSPLFLRRTLTEDKVSDSVISVDEDIIVYGDNDANNCRYLAATGFSTDNFRRFSPRRIGVKLLSSKLSRTPAPVEPKTKTTHKRSIAKILFFDRYGCLTKERD